MSNINNGRILKRLVDDTINKLSINEARLRSNFAVLYKQEGGIKVTPTKINESVGNIMTALRSDSVSWNVAYTFIKSLRFPKVSICITYHSIAGKDIEVKQTINFLHGAKKESDK